MKTTNELGRQFLGALAIFILIIGVVIVVGLAIPQYRAEGERLQNQLHHEADRRAVLADFYVKRLDDQVSAMVSRTQIRVQLAAYTDGGTTLVELRQYTQPRYIDGLSVYGDLVAAARYAADGELVAQKGDPALLPFVDSDTQNWHEGRLVRVKGDTIEIRHAIKDGARVIGQESLLFDAAGFNTTSGDITYRLMEESTFKALERSDSCVWNVLPLSIGQVVLAYRFPASAVKPDIRSLIRPVVLTFVSLAALLALAGYLTLYTSSRKILDAAENLAERRAMMVRETNHRVKNNLAIISNLVQLHLAQEGSSTALHDIESKIDLVRIIHDHLYRAPQDAPVELNTYLRTLLAAIFKAHAAVGSYSWTLEGDTIHLPEAACSDLGFIVSELTINAIKYGMVPHERKAPGDGPDGVTIVLASLVSGWSLDFRNTGNVFPEHIDPLKADSFGMELVRTYTRSLGGRLTFSRQPATTFHFEF